MKKNILVTGATGNLGNATVAQFRQDGFQVIVIVSRGRKTKGQFPEDVVVYEADLTNEDDTTTVISEVVKDHGSIDAALLLVGGFSAGGIKETSGVALSKMFSLNFNTAYFVARPVFLQMQSQTSGGRIVLVGSRPALVARDGKNYLAYALSKSLLFKLAEFLNAEGGSSNIVTSVIVPSTIDTPENRKAMPGKNFDDWVTPEEIASTMAFLIGEKGSVLREPIVKVYGNS
jgi:NAD(P)-dependent dehydrogenase (short-subunit alcohol dehydrogenase family)